MPRVVVRKGYRCRPGKRREVLAALQRVDEAGAGAGWPRGRYLFVETRGPGEPDLEVEFVFESYAEMERLERRLREHLARSARDVAGAGPDLLIEPSATRYLVLLDEIGARIAPTGAAQAPQGAQGLQGGPAPPADQTARTPQPVSREPVSQEPALTPAQLRARQLSEARAAMESAERTAGLAPEKRASQRRPAPAPAPLDGDEPDEPDDEGTLDASARSA